MCYIPTEESKRVEVGELVRVAGGGILIDTRIKEDEIGHGLNKVKPSWFEEGIEKLVCVTSGVSFLGLAIVNHLLSRGYSIRIIVHNEGDIERIRELEALGKIMRSGTYNNIRVVQAKPTDVESLVEAFEGCRGIFHTAGFIDPAGLSGYTKSMAEIEVRVSENVVEACSRTPTIRNCVLTSSLLACVWRDGTSDELSSVINHESWSDESLCAEKKLWCALGKLRAEKAAWRRAEGKGFKLATVCAPLIVGPNFCYRNPTSTFAYLKGAQEMFARGLLVTMDVMKLAEAHLHIYEAMNKTAFGRYICYDRVIERQSEAEKLAKQIGMSSDKIHGDLTEPLPSRCELSDRKFCTLMSRSRRDCFNQS